MYQKCLKVFFFSSSDSLGLYTAALPAISNFGNIDLKTLFYSNIRGNFIFKIIVKLLNKRVCLFWFTCSVRYV